MATKFKFEQVIAKFQQVKSTLPEKLSNDGQRFFMSNFKKEGFTDASFTPWPKRKNKKNNRKLLVKTGALRRAVNNSKRSATFHKITWEVGGLPYAQIHNEGGTIQKKSRKATLNFKVKRDGSSRFAKAKKANFQQDVEIGAHSIEMPKRQYMGDSFALKTIFKRKIDAEVRRVFK